MWFAAQLYAYQPEVSPIKFGGIYFQVNVYRNAALDL